MDLAVAVDLGRDAVLLGLKLAFPILAVALAVALLINIVQAATQLHDQTLAIVPRMLVTAVAALLLLPWALSQLVDYATTIFTHLPGG